MRIDANGHIYFTFVPKITSNYTGGSKVFYLSSTGGFTNDSNNAGTATPIPTTYTVTLPAVENAHWEQNNTTVTGDQTLTVGTGATFTLVADEGYELSGTLSSTGGTVSGYTVTFDANATSGTISVDGVSASAPTPTYHTITLPPVINASWKVNDTTYNVGAAVAAELTQDSNTITLVPNSGYAFTTAPTIGSYTVAQNEDGSYSFTVGKTENVTIAANAVQVSTTETQTVVDSYDGLIAAINAGKSPIYLSTTIKMGTVANGNDVDDLYIQPANALVIKRADNFDGVLFDMKIGGSLYLNDKVTLDGNNGTNPVIEAEYATINMNGATIQNNSGSAIKLTASAQGNAILNANSGAITNCGTPAVDAPGGTVNLNGSFNLPSVDLSKDNAAQTSTSALNIKSALQNSITVTPVSADAGTVVAAGSGYTLTEADMGKLTVTGQTLELKDGNVVIASKTGITTADALIAAINSASRGDTITLEGNITLASALNIAADKNIVLDLNGHTLTGPGSTSAIKVEATAQLTVKDSGDNGKLVGVEAAGIQTDGTVTVEGGTVSGSSGIWGNASTANVTVTDGTVSGTNYGITTFGTTNVTGGAVSGNVGIYNNGGSVTVSNGTVSGATYGIQNISSGTVSITGGKVEATKFIDNANVSGYGIVNAGANAEISGGEVYGAKSGIANAAPLTISGTARITSGQLDGITNGYNGAAYVESGTVTMSGGTISSNGYSIVDYNGRGTGNAITGGILESKTDGYVLTSYGDNTNDNGPGGEWTVSEGVKIKTTNTTPINAAAAADDRGSDKVMVADIASITYTDSGDGCKVVAKGITTQDALKAAITAAQDGDTIQLGADITLTSTLEIPADKNIVLDLNGKTLTGPTAGTEPAVITVAENGELTVMDSKTGGTITGSHTGIRVAGKLIFESGSIVANNDGISVSNDSTATVTVNGGSIQGGSYAIFDLSTNTTGAINGGTLIGGTPDQNWMGALGSDTSKGGTWTIATNGNVIFKSPAASDYVPNNFIWDEWLTKVNEVGYEAIPGEANAYKVVPSGGEYAILSNGVLSFKDTTSSGFRYDVFFFATSTANAMENGAADTTYPENDTITRNSATLYKVTVPKVNWNTDYVTPIVPGESNATSIGVSNMKVVNNGSGSYTYSADLTLKNLVGNSSLGGQLSNLSATNKYLWVCLSVCAETKTTDNVWYYLGEYTSYSDAANAHVVTNETELKAAVKAGGEIAIAGNITLTEQLTIPAGTTVTIDLCGKTITGNIQQNMALIKNEGNLTVINSATTPGTISNTDTTNNGCCAIETTGSLTIKGDDVNDIVISNVTSQPISNAGGSGSSLSIDGATLKGGYGGLWVANSAATNNAIKNAYIEVSTNSSFGIGGYGTWDVEPETVTIKDSGKKEDFSVFNGTALNGVTFAKVEGQEGTYIAKAPTDERTVTTLAELKKAIEDGVKEITLGADIPATGETAESVTIPSTYEGTLDLNGKTLTGPSSGNAVEVAAAGNLTVTDSSTNADGKIVGANTAISNKGTLTIVKGGLTGNTNYAIENYGTATVNGGTLYGKNYGINQPSEGNGILTVTGGTITGGRHGIVDDSNYNVNNPNAQKTTTTITGGSVTGQNGAGLHLWDGSVKADISGGKVFGTTYAVDNGTNGDSNVSITGGQFKAGDATVLNGVTLPADKALAPADENGWREVITGFNDANTINSYITSTDEEPILIILSGDVTDGGIAVPSGKTVILDLNGHSISGADVGITNYGTLTVKDSATGGTITGTKFGIQNYGALTVEAGTITGNNHEGINNQNDNTDPATSISITGGTIVGKYAAICDYATDTTSTITGGTLIRTGTDNGYVINSYGSGKGSVYTIADDVQMQNTVPGKWVNVNPSNSTTPGNGQVGLTNAAKMTFETSGTYTATVKIAERQTTMVLSNGDVYYSIEPETLTNIVRFDFQFYASSSGSNTNGAGYIGFVKANYTDTQDSRQVGVTKILPVSGNNWTPADSTTVTFTGTMDLATLTAYNGTALATTKLGGSTPYLWVNVRECNAISSDAMAGTWYCLGKFDSWSEAARLDDPTAAATAAKETITALAGKLPSEDDLSASALTGKIGDADTAGTIAYEIANADKDNNGYYTEDGKLAIAKAQAKLDAITQAAQLAADINSRNDLTDDEKAALLAQVEDMMDKAITAIDAATGEGAEAGINDAIAKAQAKAAVIKAAADALAAVDSDNAQTAIQNALTGAIDAINAKNADAAAANLAAAKAAAKMEAEVIAAQRINAINADSGLTAEDKTALIADVNAAKDKALDAIDDAASAAAAELQVDKLAAKAAVTAAAAQAYADINALPTTANNAALKAQVNTAAADANGENGTIDTATTASAVETAKQNAITAIQNVIAGTIVDTIPGLTDAEKTALKEQVKDLLDKTADNVKNAADDEAKALAQAKGDAKLDILLNTAAAEAAIRNSDLSEADKNTLLAEIAAAKTAAEEAVDDAATAEEAELAAEKLGAKLALVEAAAEAYAKIDDLPNLTEAQKTSLKTKVDNAADSAAAAIDQATTSDDVASAKNTGVAAIEKIAADAFANELQTVKNLALENINKAATAAKNAIGAMNNLSDAERAEMKAAVDSAADAVKTAVNSAKDFASAADAQEKGLKAIELAQEKAAALAAINKTDADKSAAIAALTSLTADQKTDLQNKIAAEAAAAKSAIRAAATADAVELAKDDGIEAINKIVADAVKDNLDAAKMAAKDEIDKAAADKKAEIDKLTGLDDDKKAELKAQIDAAATAAKKAIDDAENAAGVATAKNDGITAINAIYVSAVSGDVAAAKTAAIANIEQTAAAKKDEIDALTNLTTAEKTALKQSVDTEATKAKTAINAAATGDNASGEAVITAMNDGIAAIQKVAAEAVAKDLAASKAAANTALDAAAAAEQAAIDAMQHLTSDEKDALKKQIEEAVAAAKTAIVDAKTPEAVEAAETAAEEALDLIGAKAAAMDEINETAENEKAAIDKLSGLTDAQKAALQQQIDNIAAEAKAGIDAAATKEEVFSLKNDAIKAMELAADKAAAILAVKQAAADAKAEINALPNLTAAQKAAYTAEIDQAADDAVKAIIAAETPRAISAAAAKASSAMADTVDDAIAADFVRAYLTGRDGRIYSDVTRKNGAQIASGKTAWAALTAAQQAKVDAMIAGANKNIPRAPKSYDDFLDAYAHIRYTIIRGAKQTVYKGDTASFTSDAPFGKFVEVRVDGKVVDPHNYTAVSGSTRVTLSAGYIKKLSVGEHSLTIVSTDGSASTTFTVKNAEDPNVPATGDEANPVIWIALFTISMLCAVAVMLPKRKKGKYLR